MEGWADKYVIGLTGNIAVGKSVVRNMLQYLGAYTIDADHIGHLVMAPGAPAYNPVVGTFGRYILEEDGTINRKRLGNIVFNDPHAMQTLESITHPVIRRAIHMLVMRAPKPVVAIEAIKLLESPWVENVDSVWVINATMEARLNRLMKHRGLSEEEATQRIFAQTDQVDKIAQADVVIDNAKELTDTWRQVLAEWKKIKQQSTASESIMNG